MRLTKRAGLLLLAGLLAAYLGSLTQHWLVGTTSDPVLGARRLGATGAALAPGATAVALVVGAAVVALATTGPRLRYAATGLLLAASLGVAGLTVQPMLDPATALGRQVADGAGRAGSVVSVDAQLTWWAGVGVLLAVLLLLAGAAVGWSARRWSGLSGRFERSGRSGGAGESRVAGTRRTAWDELSDGRDPTG